MKIKPFLFLFISLGYGVFKEKVVVYGVCKNVEPKINSTLSMAERIGALFSDYKIIIYENNSSDNTAKILFKRASINPKILVISENLSKKEIDDISINIFLGGTFKPEFIARGRNKILDIIESEDYKDFKYVICMDLDFSVDPSYEAIKEVIKSDIPWDAVFANGISSEGHYWDKYAFRDSNRPLGPELLGEVWWNFDNFSLDFDSDWMPVYSAFGGLGIYKRESILGCRYSGIVNADLEKFYKNILIDRAENNHVKYYLNSINSAKIVYLENPDKTKKFVDSRIGICISSTCDKIVWRMNTKTYVFPGVCEHVPFHASMILKGHGNFFINPRLFVYYSRY